MKHKRDITENELYVIEQLQLAGHGWRKYASSVLSQGNITEQQSKTLYQMLHRLRVLQSDVQYRKSNTCRTESYEPDISDIEAMQSGDYF